MADNTTEIAALEAILNASASRISTDGTSVSLDLEKAAARLKQLKAEDDTVQAANSVRAPVYRMKLGGAF